MDNLKNLRIKNGYSQLQLASFLDVGASVVARWEAGHTLPSLVQIIKLCRILKCIPSALFSCCADSDLMIPVFDDDASLYQTFSLCSTEQKSDFGIILSSDTAGRLCAGDVCFFNIQNTAEKSSIVLVNTNEYDWDIVLYDDSQPHNIIAVCTEVRCSI